jgi:cysteine synthase
VVDRSLLTHDLAACLGKTPLVRLETVVADADAWVLGKLESANPSGSLKDRYVAAWLEAAAAAGRLDRPTTLVAATDGNLGLALAALASGRGHRVVLALAETASPDWAYRLERAGAEVHTASTGGGLAGARRLAAELAAREPGALRLAPETDPLNEAALRAAGEELWRQTSGRIDALVTAVGTGGTIKGIGGLLKERLTAVQVVAVRRADDAGTGQAGIGDSVELPPHLVDDTLTVERGEVDAMIERLAREEGLFVGPSAAGNVVAALRVARRLGAGRVVATILGDGGDRALVAPLDPTGRSTTSWQ